MVRFTFLSAPQDLIVGSAIESALVRDALSLAWYALCDLTGRLRS
jgi:hypothetical protein